MKRWVIALTALFLVAGISAGQEKIVITAPGFLHPAAQVLRIVLTEAYEKIGYTVEFSVAPPLRGIYNVRNGSADGTLVSDIRFGEEVPESIRVPTSILADEFVVFSKNVKLPIKTWEDLRPYRVLYMAGQFPAENRLKTCENASAGNVVEDMMLMLDRGRADALVLPRALGLMARKELGLSGIVYSDTVLATELLYHYVSSRRASLVPKLDAVLAEMAASGRVAEVTEQIYAEF